MAKEHSNVAMHQSFAASPCRDVHFASCVDFLDADKPMATIYYVTRLLRNNADTQTFKKLKYVYAANVVHSTLWRVWGVLLRSLLGIIHLDEGGLRRREH